MFVRYVPVVNQPHYCIVYPKTSVITLFLKLIVSSSAPCPPTYTLPASDPPTQPIHTHTCLLSYTPHTYTRPSSHTLNTHTLFPTLIICPPHIYRHFPPLIPPTQVILPYDIPSHTYTLSSFHTPPPHTHFPPLIPPHTYTFPSSHTPTHISVLSYPHTYTHFPPLIPHT